MKTFFLLFLTLLPGLPCRAECGPEAASALAFMNAYVDWLKVPAEDAPGKPAPWMEKDGLVSAAFRAAHEELMREAEKEDPELGLGFDPVLDAQDYPESFAVDSCGDGFVVLRGAGDGWSADFAVTVKMIPSPEGWLVDGAGMIRIPEERRRQE